MNDETRSRKRSALNKADSSGEIADSMEVRSAIMKRIHDGDITLEQGQQELKMIKRNAKHNGLLTRQQKWSRS
jgi:predicted DNA-binding protein YlxM (UPF0122 family)